MRGISVFLLLAFLGTTPALAQRLPGTIVPDHYDLRGIVVGRSFTRNAVLVSSGQTPLLVSSIGLPQTGKPKRVSGIGCQEEAKQVQSGPWSAGALSLRPQPLQSVNVPGTSGEINGLLGSDVLHGFGTVVIGYAAGTLLIASH